ncbi:MAG: serpin family protein, partial [Brachybacterium sp.]|nr:serpin family protein [Brachybacterium sp.]
MEPPAAVRPSRRGVLGVPPGVLALAASAPPAAAGLSSCGLMRSEPESPEGPQLVSDVQRAAPGDPQVAGHAAVPFTVRMLGTLDRTEANQVCSPLSVQIALVMAGLGAETGTRQAMEETLGGSMEELAIAANTLASRLAEIGGE